MPFLVTRSEGLSDADFIWYSRRLSQQGHDLGHLPRHLPEGGRHLLAVFAERAMANTLRDSLGECTGREDWTVVEVHDETPPGPLGPILLHLSCEGGSRFVALNPLSRQVLARAFPAALPILVRGEIDHRTWQAFHAPRADLAELVWELAPILTGVSLADLDELGYSLFDDDRQETLVGIAPAVLARQG